MPIVRGPPRALYRPSFCEYKQRPGLRGRTRTRHHTLEVSACLQTITGTGTLNLRQRRVGKITSSHLRL